MKYTDETYIILRALGISRSFLGYSITLMAVQLVLEDECRLQHFKHEVLTPIANALQTKPANIERNIRTVIQNAWQTEPHNLSIIARYELTQPPTVIEFIDILSGYILRQQKNHCTLQ